jgi:hypothetical protein
MDLSAQKEQFSRAFVQAVAAVAGYSWSVPSYDDDSIDMTIAEKAGRGTIRSPKLDVQLKCHAAPIPEGGHLSFPLSMKNYDDLRAANVLVPRVLIVVLVPDVPGEWLEWRGQDVLLRRTAFWLSLRDLPAVKSAAIEPRVTVRILCAQPFTPDALRVIMERIGSGGVP